MKRAVVFHRDADEDLNDIAGWITEQASATTARNYAARIRKFCSRFDIFPERGTRRDDLAPGLRTIGFEKRVTVVFTMTEDTVVILRLLYGGRDVDSILAPPGEDLT
ncbi:MAG: type II toxin-antitoxin system RelE/ParE family toxin [Caulobacterales bacterium]